MKSIYLSSSNEMREIPEIGNPLDFKAEDGKATQQYNERLKIWSDQNAACKTYPCISSRQHSFKDGEVYEEGKDYEFGTDFSEGQDPRQMVFPIRKQESEDELWEDVLHITDDPKRDYSNADESTIAKLKQSFHLSRKNKSK